MINTSRKNPFSFSLIWWNSERLFQEPCNSFYTFKFFSLIVTLITVFSFNQRFYDSWVPFQMWILMSLTSSFCRVSDDFPHSLCDCLNHNEDDHHILYANSCSKGAWTLVRDDFVAFCVLVIIQLTYLCLRESLFTLKLQADHVVPGLSGGTFSRYWLL